MTRKLTHAYTLLAFAAGLSIASAQTEVTQAVANSTDLTHYGPGVPLTGANFCHTEVTPEVIAQALNSVQTGSEDAPAPHAPGDFRLIRVALHIVRTSAGTGGISPADIQVGLAVTNTRYEPSKLVFVPVTLDYIDNDTYYDLSDSEVDSLRHTQVVPAALNIWFVNSAPFCGKSSFPDSTGPQGIVMVNSCTALNGVLAHEVGHFYNLFHTHDTSMGYDCPSSSACATRGDLCCDTPPDPGLHTCDADFTLGSCVENCTYTGTGTCFGFSYQPDVTNLMSYSDVECLNNLSNQQRGRITDAVYLANRAPLIIRENPCGKVFYADSAVVGVGLGNWGGPDPTIRGAINRSSSGCAALPSDPGAVVVKRGVYHEGTAVFNIPATLIASREGTGAVVEIRP